VDLIAIRRRSIAAALALAGLFPAAMRAQTPTQDLKRMTLEDLMSIEIFTVSRAPERATAVPAALFVITQDDIRRSGATSLPEVLRLAPGIDVARLDAARYAVGVRGFADRLARSMLVLIDGRAVYSPLFAGTYWEVQDTLLPDIDRIEVIRGPGGTLWGANAVNGIINIVTKHARDTQGGLATGSLGSHERGPFGVRYGGAVGEGFHFRAYARGFDRDAQFHPGGAAFDDWRMVQGGFRGDWTLARARTLTLQGDAYAVSLGQRVSLPSYTPPFGRTVTRDAPLSGGNVLARWSAPAGETGELRLQTYYDGTNRDELPVAERRDTFDVDFQHARRLRARHHLVWGLGYRVSSSRITAVLPTEFTPQDRTDSLYSAFIQDEVPLVPERLRVVFGTKVEHNAYSGVEFQPSGRVVWTLNPSSTLVWSVTRAVRTPSRVETDYTTTSLVSPALPTFVRLLPNREFKAEELVAYEAGYRVRPIEPLYVTVSGFYNQHENALSTELLTPFVETMPLPPRLILPVMFRNGLHGNSHGIEVTADARPASWLRWSGSYSYLRVQVTRNPGSTDVSQERRYEGLSPRHKIQLHSSIDLPRRVTVDWLLRYASELPAGPVAGYATSNLRLAWQPTPDLEVALVGSDLHEARHVEWPGSVQIERRAHLMVTWRR
jgi:iron complex outermembrane receptor protein